MNLSRIQVNYKGDINRTKGRSMQKCVVLLSGGQDSTTCLYWAIDKFKRKENIETVTIDYGQRHRVELKSAVKIAEIAGVRNKILPINSFSYMPDNSLLNDEMEIDNSVDKEGIPNTFVPGRNIIFISIVAAYAYSKNIKDLVIGVSQTDYSGYPDCREDTIRSLNKTINLGMEYDFNIHTPLMYKSKADIVKLAIDYGAMDALAWSHTCYKGESPPCGKCPACILRARGFKEAGVQDPVFKNFSKDD